MTIVEPISVAGMTPAPTVGPRKAEPHADALNERLFEVVQGVRVEKAMSAFQLWLGSRIHGRLDQYCLEHGIGIAVSEMMFRIPSRGNDRKPDVAFVSSARWPMNRVVPSVQAWPVVPDLAIEVVSPTDTVFNVFDKVQEYFEADVRQVWLILSNIKQAYIFSSPDAVKIIGSDGELTGGDVVPGFRLPMRMLFPVSESDAAS